MSKHPTIAELEQKIGELTEALQRERADAENLRRRTEEDKANLGTFYKVMIIRELLPALDNLERAKQHAFSEEDFMVEPAHEDATKVPIKVVDLVKRYKDYERGVEATLKQFSTCLAQLGVERIKTVGEHFDPKLHEAVHMEHGPGKVEVVCEELQPGYKIGDEIIRHAMVKVKMEKK